VHHALQNNLIKEFGNILEIKPETKFGLNTRFDFLVTDKKHKTFIEVKNVTLSRKKSLAEFPDAVTTRGLKHINELLKASKKGYKVFILYLIQRDDCKLFTVAKDIDPNYAIALSKAVKNKLKILCYDCKFSSKGIKLNNKIKLKI
jgi:sugar fermentation stimulation protein A